MNIYEKIEFFKKEKKLTNKDLSTIAKVTPDAFRMAIKRESLNDFQIQAIEQFFEKIDIGSQSSMQLREPGAVYNISGEKKISITSIEQLVEYLVYNQDTLLNNTMYRIWHDNVVKSAKIELMKELGGH